MIPIRALTLPSLSLLSLLAFSSCASQGTGSDPALPFDENGDYVEAGVDDLGIPDAPNFDVPKIEPVTPRPKISSPTRPKVTSKSSTTKAQPKKATKKKVISKRPAKPAPITSYRVQKGDNVWKIANKTKAKYSSILRANGLKESSIIRPGQVLKIPR